VPTAPASKPASSYITAVLLQLAAHLALRGYTFVGSDLYQPLPPAMAAAFARLRHVPRGKCPPGKILKASAGLIPNFLSWALNSTLPAVQVGAAQDALLCCTCVFPHL
jgi:hypothetical protein